MNNVMRVTAFALGSVGINASIARVINPIKRSINTSIPRGGIQDDDLIKSLKSGTSLNAEELILIVDPENNEVVRKGVRSEMRLEKLCHRATYIFLKRPSDGSLFVQLRSSIKDYKPSHYDPTPGGVVGYGESYEDNAKRELEEEMGLEDVQLKWCFTFHYKDSDVDTWGDAWEGEWEGKPEDLKLQEEEVESVECMRVDEILERAERGEKFTADSVHAVKLWSDWKEGWEGGKGGRKAFKAKGGD